MTSIYLAGKIGANDWRTDLVPLLDITWGTSTWQYAPVDDLREAAAGTPWPTIPDGVLGLYDYTGPYFTEECTHSPQGCPYFEHRLAKACEGAEISRASVVRLCLDAISRSDIVFAWLDDVTAHGTLVELGYAHGLGKRICIAAPELPPSYTDVVFDPQDSSPDLAQLWFAFSLGRVIQAPDPRTALETLAQKPTRLDSPIEVAFWNAYDRDRPDELRGLVTQHPVFAGRYRIDFALPHLKVGIEVDGYQWHSSREVFTTDRERQRNLEGAGWRLIRFSGAEINKDASACVRQAAELVAGFGVTA